MRTWDGSFGGSGRCRRAQALVNSLLGEDAPVVRYQGSEFKHVYSWSDRKLVDLAADWFARHPGRVPGEKEIQAWHIELQKENLNTRNEIFLGVFPPESTPQLEAALDGAALHEAFHGKFSRKAPLRPDEIRSLVVDRWLELDWKAFAAFVLLAHNVFEDVRCERKGIQAYPGCLVFLEALREFCVAGRCANPQNRSRVGNLLYVLNFLGHDIRTSPDLQLIEAIRQEDPALLSEVEHGSYLPILEALRAIDLDDDLAAMNLAIRLAAQLAKEGFGGQVPGAANSCPRCGAPASKLTGLLLPKTSHASAKRTLLIRCGGCGETFQTEVDASLTQPCSAAGSGGSSDPSEGMVVIDLEATQAAASCNQAGLSGGAVTATPSACPSIEDALREGMVRARGASATTYLPYDPGLDSTVVLSVDMSLRGKADQMRAEVEQEVCALRAGLRRRIRSVRPRSVRSADEGIDLSEANLVETLFSLRQGEPPARAFEQVRQKAMPSAAAVFVIDLSSSMSGWVREAGKIMLAGATAFEDVRFASACLGFRGTHGSWSSGAGSSRGFHRSGGAEIAVFKFFHERVGLVMTRFAKASAMGGTPMAEGMQAGIEALGTRPEALRMLFLISDGEPDAGTEDTVRSQVRAAAARGLYVCGIGIGSDASQIVRLIPGSILAEQIKDVPTLLLERIGQVTAARPQMRNRC